MRYVLYTITMTFIVSLFSVFLIKDKWMNVGLFIGVAAAAYGWGGLSSQHQALRKYLKVQDLSKK